MPDKLSSPPDTIAYYDRHASEFALQTGSIDLSSLHDRFLRHVPPSGRILDAGCGAGRDALAFAERGYAVVAFDASQEMVRLARARVGGKAVVHLMAFDDVEWRDEFDGIWACASLLHVPSAEFPGVAAGLRRLCAVAAPGTCPSNWVRESARRKGGCLSTIATRRCALR